MKAQSLGDGPARSISLAPAIRAGRADLKIQTLLIGRIETSRARIDEKDGKNLIKILIYRPGVRACPARRESQKGETMQTVFRILVAHFWAGLLLLCLAPTLRAQSLEFGPPYTISGGFQNPYGVAINRTQSHLLVAIQKPASALDDAQLVDRTPTFQTFGFVSDANAADALIDPEGIAADATGHIYVVDARRNQVNLYTWNAMSSNYVYDSNFASATRNSVAGTGIQSPRDIAIGPDGKVYLLDSGRKRILRADNSSDTSWEVFLTDTSLANPYGLDVGPDGRVYIADTDNHRIVRYNATGGGSVSFGRYGTGPEQFRYPRDVGVDIDGRMYVIDSHNHRLQILDLNGHHLLALGQAPSFGSVQKVVLDADRHVYIADSDRDAVIAFLGRDVPVPFDVGFATIWG